MPPRPRRPSALPRRTCQPARELAANLWMRSSRCSHACMGVTKPVLERSTTLRGSGTRGLFASRALRSDLLLVRSPAPLGSVIQRRPAEPALRGNVPCWPNRYRAAVDCACKAKILARRPYRKPVLARGRNGLSMCRSGLRRRNPRRATSPRTPASSHGMNRPRRKQIGTRIGSAVFQQTCRFGIDGGDMTKPVRSRRARSAEPRYSRRDRQHAHARAAHRETTDSRRTAHHRRGRRSRP